MSSLADWDNGISIELHPLVQHPLVQLFTIAGNGWPHNVPQYHKAHASPLTT